MKSTIFHAGSGPSLLFLCLFSLFDFACSDVHAAPRTALSDGGGGGIITYVYTSMTGPQAGFTEIYSINIGGTGNVRLSDEEIPLNHPCCSPDGSRLCVVGYFPFTSWEHSTWSLHLLNADGTGLTRLTTAVEVWDSEPAWSPDGTRIAFHREYALQDHRQEIWIMNADGTGQHWIGIEGFAPKWSPDCSRLVYQSHKNGPEQMFICDSDGANEERLMVWPISSDEIQPSWSPDGSRIAFTTNRGGGEEVYIVNVDGSDPRQLTCNGAHKWGPKWSPDGTLLVFCSALPDDPDRREVFVVGADGSNLLQVTNMPYGVTAYNPDWKPVDSSTVDIFLSSFNCTATDGAVTIVWCVPGEARPSDFMLTAEAGGGIRILPIRSTESGCFEGMDEGPGHEPGAGVVYRLYSLEENGGRTLLRTERIELESHRTGTGLLQVYPNPFNPNVTISFSVDRAQRIRLEIYDAAGRRVDILSEEMFHPGEHTIQWNGISERDDPMLSGVYFVRLSAGKTNESRKLVLIR